MSFTSPPEPIGANATFTVISNQDNIISGLTSISTSHLNWDVSSPPNKQIPFHYIVNGANNLHPLQITFLTSENTSSNENGPLPLIKNILNNISNVVEDQKEVIQFISHNTGSTLNWAGYYDSGGGTVTLSTPFPGAPFAQLANTSYLITLVITPKGTKPNWTNSSMKISCLLLAN